jgi:hypothetical protein
MFLIIPGRHHVITEFQINYLKELLGKGMAVTRDARGAAIPAAFRIDAIIFAITSANHSGTRRNPLPFYLRAIAVEKATADLPVPVFIYGIDDVGDLNNFATYTLKRISHDSEQRFVLSPENTIVLCSTKVLLMYEQLGFRILPAELDDIENWTYSRFMPWDIVSGLANAPDETSFESYRSLMHEASMDVWTKYGLFDKIKILFRDAMISADGELTSTRDYAVYVKQMDEIAASKFLETQPHIQPGRIGDIGCAVGSWIKRCCEDERLRESEFYGIEVSRPLFEICRQRKENGEFNNPFVFFAQKNAVSGLVFEPNSMHTIHTSSLTHEIESYGGRKDLIQFISNRYAELRSGGVWVNRDVVGPFRKTQTVLMQLADEDGVDDDGRDDFASNAAKASYLATLSTLGRFRRFSNDFRKLQKQRFEYNLEEHKGEIFVKTTLQFAVEFLSKKDYTDNWDSEMNETFCFWDFDEWREHLLDAGFTILPISRCYTNTWITEHRWTSKVQLFDENHSPLEWPVTHMMLIAAKP